MNPAELFVMRLFAKMKMGRNRMLEQMHQKKPNQHEQQGAFAGKPNRLGNDFDKPNRQHVSCAQRQKILQVLPRPVLANNEVPANQIAERRKQPQQRRQRSEEHTSELQSRL